MTFAGRIVVIDTETTGLDAAGGDQIIQYCAQVWNGLGSCGPSVARYVLPTRPVDPRAAAVNGYDEAIWRERYQATPFDRDDVIRLTTILDGAVLLGSNPNFDRGFIAEECKRLGHAPPKWSHRSIDTASLAAPLWVRGAVGGTGLEAVAKALGVRRLHRGRAQRRGRRPDYDCGLGRVPKPLRADGGVMKAGEIHKLAERRSAVFLPGGSNTYLQLMNTSSDLDFAKADAVSAVSKGEADVVYVVKVLAVVRRSARVEE